MFTEIHSARCERLATACLSASVIPCVAALFSFQNRMNVNFGAGVTVGVAVATRTTTGPCAAHGLATTPKFSSVQRNNASIETLMGNLLVRERAMNLSNRHP